MVAFMDTVSSRVDRVPLKRAKRRLSYEPKPAASKIVAKSPSSSRSQRHANIILQDNIFANRVVLALPDPKVPATPLNTLKPKCGVEGDQRKELMSNILKIGLSDLYWGMM